MNKLYSVYEFDTLRFSDRPNAAANILPRKAFEELRDLLLAHEENPADRIVPPFDKADYEEAGSCMRLGIRGGQEVITVRNYVGIVSLKCGISIEILPKISTGGAGEQAKQCARRLVVEMLKECGTISYKQFQQASLTADKLNLFEAFISLFIDEVNELYRRGLKAGYISVEDNERLLKGKLLIGEHIKKNMAHKERFFVGYDEFGFDRAENKLIKSTLLYLKNKSADESNKRAIRRLLLAFDEIAPSDNFESDFAKCETGRTAKEYDGAIKLCRVFLRKKSFTMYSGSNDAVALLFPMETMFERFIASKMRSALQDEWTVSTQDRGKYLFDSPRKFTLRPDIFLQRGQDERIIIDTKWKLLNGDSVKNYGISQADMYQMYAYHTRYENVRRVILLYPKSRTAESANMQCVYSCTAASCKVTIEIKLFDLERYISQRDSEQFKEIIM